MATKPLKSLFVKISQTLKISELNQKNKFVIRKSLH